MASPDIPSTHSALTFTRRGNPLEVLTITHDYPTPRASTLRVGEALIKVSAVAMNAGVLLGVTLFPHLTSNPWIPDMEFAGTIVAKGPTAKEDTDGLRVGDEVIGVRDGPSFIKYNGAMQSYLVSNVRLLIRKPKTISMIDASGLSGVGCTALQAFELAGVKRGDKVLVTGGSGGLGSMCVQMARAVVGESGTVVATCSSKNEEFVKSLGADETIDYKVHDPLHKYLKEHHSSTPFNAIFDIAGSPNELFTSSPFYLTKRGVFVLLGGISVLVSLSWFSLLYWVLQAQVNRFLPSFLGGTPRRSLFYSASPNRTDMKRVCEMVEAGKVRPVIDSVWKFEDVKMAYERAMSQRARGKILVDFE